jgi:hypothetical protein
MTTHQHTIPAWNSAGILPPIHPSVPATDIHRSPYSIDITVFVARFAISPERIKILTGLLDYRIQLYNTGITSGFQWLDGSFLEHIEVLENRAPNDIDVVTFFDMPAGHDQQSLFAQHPQLFDRTHNKSRYTIDAYFVEIGQPITAWHVKYITYWYSMWSHQRDGTWKGFVQVALNPALDADARTLILTAGGGHHA